jgi:iron-sulfur cluster repair protein YtfE (RIC family)
MKITDALLGEHGVFYAQFAHLEQVAPVAPTLAQVQGLAASLAAALSTHAAMEDELLFTALDPYLGGGGPLTVMRMEHDQIESALAQIQAARELAEAQRLVFNAIQVARDHFAKEEQILFYIAQQMLGDEALARLGRQWADRRGVVVRAAAPGQTQ